MLNIFKNKHQNREFTYKPRFYDPDKEALRERIALRERVTKAQENAELSKIRISQQFEEYRRTRKKSMGLWKNSSTLRIFLILGILLSLAYLALDRWMPALMHFWFPNNEY